MTLRTKSFIMAILVLGLALPSFAGYGYRSVLFENFESISPPNLPSGWATVNANGDQGIWETRRYNGVKWGRNCIRYVRDPLTPANDWVFTSGVDLLVGEDYTLEFMYRASSASHPEAMTA